MRWSMLLVAAVLLIGAMFVLMANAPGPAETPEERALAALDESGWRSPESLLAFRSHWASMPIAHWSQEPHPLEIPAEDDDPFTGLRTIHATFYGPRGPPGDLQASLLDRLERNIDRARNATSEAAISFQILAMEAAGLDGTVLRDALLGRIAPAAEGEGWGCGAAVRPECTAFALWALAESGGVPVGAAENATSYLWSTYADGPFADPNLGPGHQVTAWAIIGLHAAGQPVPTQSLDWIAEQQADDGMWHRNGQPDPWGTADVLFMSRYVAL